MFKFVSLSDHMIDSIAWVTDLNLLALKTRHGWRQVSNPDNNNNPEDKNNNKQ